MCPWERQGELGGGRHPDDPTEDQIMDAFGWSYTPEGVDKVMDQSRHLLRTQEGRRQLYDRAVALAEGTFS